jgi:ParB family chromosome partitioning protein
VQVAPEQVSRLAKLKKVELANEAERLVAGTGWLPAMFRGAEEPDTEVQAVSAVEAEATAADADHEQEPALA